MRAEKRRIEFEVEQTPAESAESEQEEPRREEGPLTDVHIGIMSGALVGFAVGLITAALIGRRRREDEK